MTSQISWADLSLLIPFTILFVFSVVPITFKVLNKNTEMTKNFIFLVAFVGACLAIVFTGFQTVIEPRLAFEGTVIFDGLTWIGNLTVIAIGAFVLLLSKNHPAIPSHQYSEHIFLVFSTLLGMIVLNFANDLIMSFIGIELLSLPLYVLIGLGGADKISKEAAFKYFVLGSFASAFLLYGIALIYGAAHTTQIDQIINNQMAIQQTTFQVGLVIFLVGLFFKMALVPFHSWLPDVYQGAPTPITAFMAAGVKLVTFFFVLRIVPVTKLFTEFDLLKIFEWFAVLTMIVGSLAALHQVYIKRVIAYSSIAHTGYIFMGIIAAIKGDFQQSIYGIVAYIIIYTVMTIGVFAIIGHFEKKQDTQLTLDDFKGLANRKPVMSVCLTLLLLSLAGIPPMGGFFAKLMIFSTAMNAGLYWLVVWGVLTSVMSVYYYLKPVVNMYMHKSDVVMQENRGYSQKLAVYACTALVVVSGLLIQPIIERLSVLLFR